MKWTDVVILGIVEGVTEFLPISSTGHLILTATILGLPQTEFLKTFEIAIQLGAILSVVVLYARSLIRNREMILKVVTAFLPTALVGLMAYRVIKHFLLGSQTVVLLALISGGILLILFELFYRRRANEGSVSISYSKAFLVGLCQAVAMIPGVSRSAATIIGGLYLGISRTTIVEFSFLLAIPTMAAATGLDLLKTETAFSVTEWKMLAAGFVIAFIVALLSVKFLLYFIQKHSFISFGIYRIALGLVYWLVM